MSEMPVLLRETRLLFVPKDQTMLQAGLGGCLPPTAAWIDTHESDGGQYWAMMPVIGPSSSRALILAWDGVVIVPGFDVAWRMAARHGGDIRLSMLVDEGEGQWWKPNLRPTLKQAKILGRTLDMTLSLGRFVEMP